MNKITVTGHLHNLLYLVTLFAIYKSKFVMLVISWYCSYCIWLEAGNGYGFMFSQEIESPDPWTILLSIICIDVHIFSCLLLCENFVLLILFVTCAGWNLRWSTQSWWKLWVGLDPEVRWLRSESSFWMIRIGSLWGMLRDQWGKVTSLPCSSLREKPEGCVDGLVGFTSYPLSFGSSGSTAFMMC